MSQAAPRLSCAACGWSPGPLEVDPYPFRCPNAGSDAGDHVIRVVGRDFSPAVARPSTRSGRGEPVEPRGFSPANGANPFIRYRSSLYSWHAARARGVSDADYISLVERVDDAVARVAGHGFAVTPFSRADRLSERLGFEADGGVWVKDETGNVAGSHKARHLMGIALYLEVLRALGIDRDTARPLAIASCGNAALAAAVVARAIERRLLVFVPDHASPAVVWRLENLGAVVTRCARAGPGGGDPSYAAFRDAVSQGALPFSCQGNENGLVIEGATTLLHEMLDQARDSTRAEQARPLRVGDDTSCRGRACSALDRLFIQVGGGALASACVQALATAVATGRLSNMPRIHAVQTRGGHPLTRAYDRLLQRIAESPGRIDAAMHYARTHRSEFMWPWEVEPRSVASGILDDETYDWAAVVEGLARSGGSAVVVDEGTIEEANALARETTAIDVDHTGSSGLAGLVALARTSDRPGPDERIAVLFTGVRR